MGIQRYHLHAFKLIYFVGRQFYDLIEIFRIGGFAPDTNYLFLGMSALRS
jgi:hypothetical protein